MIDWLTIIIALVIIVSLIGGFGFLAWKINMPDPVVRDETNPSTDSIHDKRRKEKNSSEQSKKKRKDQKKSKRENKDDEEKPQQKRNKPLQTSEETDDEREESEQELLNAQIQTVETSSKARKRNKNKTHTGTPPPPPPSTTSSESQTKNPRAPPVTHPKSAPKDELELIKQQPKVQTSNKQTLPTPVSTTTTNKKSTQNVQKQQQQEQPFTVVGGNRNKTTTPPAQQNKPQVNPVAPVQHEQLTQRQQLPQIPVTVSTVNPLTVKQASTVPPKIADLIKVLPSSQVVVTELMSALDAFPLSPDELDIIMHKIANKQSVVKQDWSKLQQGQKVDPQAHIGQVLDESAKAYEDDLKNNSMKHIKELTNELNAEKRRNNDLLKEKNDKEREIQILHAQLDSTQHKTEPSSKAHPQQKLQTLELQLQRITEDNILLTQQLAQQKQHVASNLINSNDAANLKVQVLSEQIKKLSVDNANWEKKANSNELLAKEAQKEKEDLIRYNEQLTQSLQKAEKDLKHVEEKHHKQLNESRTSHLNEINEYKIRIQQLETDNEQLKREEIVHVEPSTTTDIQTITINNEEREEFENEIQQLKQEIQRIDESRNNELNSLRVELNELKSILSKSEERLRQEREKQRHLLADLLTQDLRKQLPNDNQDFDQWLSSYRQLSESSKQNLHDESEALKRENAQLHKNMTEIENQLKEIENTVQSKEETLLAELKNKDAIVEKLHGENDQLKNELQHLQSIHNASVSDERFLIAANSPSIATADDSFELVKQLSPSQSPIVIDIRAEQLNELIRSSKEALENQDSATQQLDKHLNDMHHSGLGETSKVDDSTVSSSSNQQS